MWSRAFARLGNVRLSLFKDLHLSVALQEVLCFVRHSLVVRAHEWVGVQHHFLVHPVVHKPSSHTLLGDRDRGGSNLRKLEGGWKFLISRGPWYWLLSTEILSKIANWGVKIPSLRGATFGASPPPPFYRSVRFDPPYPGLRNASCEADVLLSTQKHTQRIKVTQSRAALKVMDPNLWKFSVFCEICGFLQFPAPSKSLISRRRGETAKICGFLRKSAFCALSVTSGSSP